MIKPAISLQAAIVRLLGEHSRPVISRFQLSALIWELYRTNTFNGQALRPHRSVLDRAAFERYESRLVDTGVLKPVPGLSKKSAYMLLGANVSDPRVLACELDPFCYVSHLSAMEFHGLTDRLPEILYLSTPAPGPWKMAAVERMQKELGESYEAYVASELPSVGRIAFDKLLGRTIHRFASLHAGAYRSFKDQHLRVATLGRTFLDMLHEPQLCGGLSHVLQVYKEHAPMYFRLIADEIDQHGTAIDKVRAGYILETLCGLRDVRIDAWVAHAARGGSRKLDASADYSPEFSERWCLSINTVLPAQ